MQHEQSDIALVTPDAAISAPTHGGRAKCLQRLVRLELPVPKTVALSFDVVQGIAANQMPDMGQILDHFEPDTLLCVRPSSLSIDWGGPKAILNIGMNHARFSALSETLGTEAAAKVYYWFIQAYSIHVARLDPEIFDHIQGQGQAALEAALRAYEDETEEVFPQAR